VAAREVSARSARSDAADGPRTVADVWRLAVAEERAGPAYLVESASGWREISWAESAERVRDLANGLLSRGIAQGERVGILGRTTLEWVELDLALTLVGAIGVPIYPTSSAEELRSILERSTAVALFAEDEPPTTVLDGLALRTVLRFSSLGDVAGEGREHAHRHPDALDARAARIAPDDAFTYQYTSGTAGRPKGCLVLHRNYVAMLDAVERLPDLVRQDEVVLHFLPLAHNFGRLLHLAGVRLGFTTALLADPRRARDVLPVVRPTILPAVPRLWEKVQSAISDEFAAATGARKRVLDWALDVGRRASERTQRGEPLPRGLALQHRAADRLVYSKVKERLGGRLRIGLSGAAPLARETAEFFHALDILVLEGYGQSECTTACAVNLPGAFRFGTVGRPLPGLEVRVAEDGEILVRGDTVFAAYLDDEAATREALDADGWLHTGDLGSLDADGYLAITGRKKDLLVTSGGKNVAPQPLESALAAHPLISNAVVVGDRRPYVTALLALDDGALREWASARGSPWDAVVLAESEELRAALQAVVDRANAGRSRPEQVKRFAILPRDLSAEAGELTATLKVRRRVVAEHFAAEIEALYSADGAGAA
jgi:long-chain acyl-CoA synthetase